MLIVIWEFFFFFKGKYREESNTCAFSTARNRGATISLSLLPVTLIAYIFELTHFALYFLTFSYKECQTL